MVVEEISFEDNLLPLTWRHKQHPRTAATNAWDGTTSGRTVRPAWPEASTGSGASSSQRYARVKVEGRWFLLQAASDHRRQTLEQARVAVQTARAAAAYAHRFNSELLIANGIDAEASMLPADCPVPTVRVCLPVGCTVLESGGAAAPLAPRGSAVLLFHYPLPEVNKFVFDGCESFLELPHAFFHYVAWASGGSEMVCDLQGWETEDKDVLLVDPCLLKAPAKGVPDLLANITGALNDAGVPGGARHHRPLEEAPPSPELFERMHPKCGPLCRTFDPQRKGAKARPISCTACGFGGR